MPFVLWIVASLMVLRLVADLVLSALNRAEVRRHAGTPPPAVAAIMDRETYSRAVAYTLEKSRFSVLTEVFDTLVLALVIGKRIGFGKEPMRPHNLTLTMLGAGLLWFGWYGFNVGSIVFSGSTDEENIAQFYSETGVTFLNTTIATCAAMLGWLLVERLLHGKATSLGAASGIVAGLVAITPSCGAVELPGAILIGAVAGGLCAWAVGLKYRLGMDDSLDVVGVHLVGGVVGTVLIGLVSSADAPGGIDGLFYGGGLGSLGDQVMAALIAIVWSAVATALIAFAIKFTIGWRIAEEAEVEGIDSDQHGEGAYDLHAGLGGGATSSSVLAKSTVTEGVNA